MLVAERLRVLVEVAHAGSIAAAARNMGFTASALSQQLARLEREAGCALVERRTTGASLTEAGRRLVAHGETIVGELRAAEQTLAELRDRPPATLSVGTFATAGQVLFPQVVGEFRRAHPATRLRLVDVEPPDGYELVVSGELDLLITHRYPGRRLPPARGLTRVPLLADRLRLVLPAHHPAARTDRAGGVKLADLVDEDWISADRPSLDLLAAQDGVEPRIAYETRDYAAILALVRAGLGVALAPASVLRGADGVVVRDLAGSGLDREVYAVHRPRPAAPVPAVLGLLTRVAARLS
ncbi:LysR substrate-binding domain-containing protein [Amycolatopsis granulosa]|uniref:LysR substrate-binding domain-containing protein n=1 Tax=Amycolatopsis granulosa TaxID=185684 RepID=UPI0014231A1E|nr:LysR substrate-binding domain-containing protein [Amycolatopsis granulosa]NIH86234.1 molybdate transport repressor ModE-like protein [Amycolatopsis granulosa]